jgi:Mg2+ and Co2+ transporter CorA
MTPLVLIFGTDKNDVLLMISMALGLGLFFVSSVVSSLFLSNFANAELVFRLIYLVFSIVLFAALFMLSTFIYKRKEL